MSTQGTGAIQTYSLERLLLNSWGDWARAGGAESGYSGMAWLRKRTGGTPLFGDNTMLAVDITIAKLPKFHKRTLKKVYLSRRGILLSATIKDSALSAFAEEWAESEEYILEC